MAHPSHFEGNTKATYPEGFFKIDGDENFYYTIKQPDYNYFIKGIYRYKGEADEDSETTPKE